MSEKVRLTKDSLKHESDQLKVYRRYLPTLQLKKQQLQMEVFKVYDLYQDVRARQEDAKSRLDGFTALLSSDFPWENLISIDKVVTSTLHVAGLSLPEFKELKVAVEPFDMLTTPLWIDSFLPAYRDLVSTDAELRVLSIRRKILTEELQRTSQRVNLFEKVKIPEALTNIRRIKIYLDDEQTNGIVRGKIAKKKILQGQAKGDL